MFDPYAALGVSKTSTQDEIKKAYRKLAKKLHPDLNPGNKEAEKKFKEVSHAFDLIGTPEAKTKFDRGETQEHEQSRYEEASRQRRGPFYSNTQEDPEGGRYTYSFQDGMGDDDLFEAIFGARGRKGQRGRTQGGFPGEDQLFQIEVEFEEAALGAEKIITLPNGKKLQVKIPAGIEEGKKLRFSGQGSPGTGGAPAGDLYLEIKIKSKEGLKRVGKDIEMELPISIFEAVLGGEVPVTTLDGQVMLKIPAGSSSGSRLRVKGKGAGAGEARGNLLVSLKIIAPKQPSDELKESLKPLSEKFAYDSRTKS
jgi:DnaJ-class molecular chaperone